MAKKDETMLTYRELQAQLDDTLAKLEDPELDIDQATVAYEQGLILIQKLEGHLQSAENKIVKVRADFTRETV